MAGYLTILLGTSALSATATTTETLTLTETNTRELRTRTATETATSTALVKGEINVPGYLPSVFFNPDYADVLALNFTVSVTPPMQDYTGVTLTPAASLAKFSPASVTFTPSSPQEFVFLMYGHLVGEDAIRWTVTPASDEAGQDVQKFKMVGSTTIDVKPRINFEGLRNSRGEWISYDYSKGEYPGVPSAPLTIELVTRPEMGLEVRFSAANDSGLTFTPDLLSYDPTNLVREVRITCQTPGEYPITTVLGGSDPPLMYANQPSWTHRCLEPVETTLTYSGTQPAFEENDSELYLIVPQARHRDYEGFDLRLTCASSPSGLTFDPAIVVISSQSGAGFTTKGPKGTYNVTCTTHSYTDSGGTARGVHNPGFVNPPVLVDVVVIERDVVTLPVFPTLRMVQGVVDGRYGGAFSPLVEVKLSTAPRVEVVVTPVADSVEFLPPRVTFPPGVAVQKLRARGTQIAAGIPITYTLSGASALNYVQSTTGSASIDVTGPSPNCASAATSTACGALWDDQCWWDGATCRNDISTLSFTPANPEAQYHNEARPVIVKLAAPTVNGVTLNLGGVGLTYSETNIVFPPGEDTGTYTVSGVMGEGGVTARLNMVYDLSGPDFNKYARPAMKQLVVLAPLKVIPPTTEEYPFLYVESESAVIYTLLEVAPVNGITLRAKSSPGGLVFTPEVMVFGPGVSSGGFTVTAASETGSYNVTWEVGGVDAAKYDTPPWATVKVFTTIRVHSTPISTLADEVWSPPQYVQMETAPIHPIDVTIYAVSASNPDHVFPPAIVQLAPNAVDPPPDPPASSITLTFSATQRTVTYRVRGMTPGWYGVRFSLGPHKENFTDPPMRDFHVAQPAVWAHTRGQNGVEPKCRVAVGRIGYASRAVQDVTQETCSISDILDADVLCNVGTKLECDNELRTNARPCVWVNDACKFGLPNGNVTHYSIGETHSIFRLLDGGLWSAGSNTFGQLGHSCNGAAGCTDSIEYKEVLFDDLDDQGNCKTTIAGGSCRKISASELTNYGVVDYVTGIVTGSSHSMALTVSGRLYTWGANNHGQLGVKTLQQMVATPRVVPIPERPLVETIKCISGGAYHSVAVSDVGEVYVWGWNYYGQLGHVGSYRKALRDPVKIASTVGAWMDDLPVSVSTGDYHTVVGTASGAVYTFGRNNYGQLARVTEFNDPVPTVLPVSAPPAVFHGGASTRAWGCRDEDRVNFNSWPVGTDFTLGRGELSVYDRQR